MPGGAVSDALSIFGAAADAGAALALVDGERRHAFADLAHLAQRRLDDLRPAMHGPAEVPVVGRNSVEAIVTLYALLELHDDDGWGLATPLARVGGLSIVTRCLAARRAVGLAPAFDAAQLPRWIDEQRVTLLSLVPAMLAMLLDAHPRWQPPPQLRAVLLGGDAAPAALRRRAAERGLPIVVTYGCTETCSQVAATPYALRVDDGRILVRGPMRMTGYVGEPALAADAWFDTGNLGALLRERLAPHKRPRRIAWVDALPKTPAGKLDRAALPARAHALRPPRG